MGWGFYNSYLGRISCGVDYQIMKSESILFLVSLAFKVGISERESGVSRL